MIWATQAPPGTFFALRPITGTMRLARLNVPGVLYHVICRFIGRAWFMRGDVERETYLRLFAHSLRESDWRCFAYALMSTHIHLAMVAGSEPLANWAKRVHCPFADWINQRFDRVGPVFAHRPKDFAVLPENERSVIAYIHNNPVAAKLVCAARDSHWTSHRAYAGLESRPPWLDVDGALARTGFGDGEQFDRWVSETPGESAETKVDEFQREIRARGALVLATPTGGVLPSVPIVARPFAYVRPDPARLIQVVAEVTGIPEPQLCSRRRVPAMIAAREIAVHAGRAMGLTLSDIAAALGVTPQGVASMGRRTLSEQCVAVAETVLARMQAEHSSMALCQVLA